jgi:hypothetical protein
MGQQTFATLLGARLAHIRAWPSVLWRLEARIKGVEMHGPCELVGRPLISVAAGSRMVFGAGVRIASALRSNPLACFQPAVLRTLASGAQLILAPASGLSGTVLCAAASIEVGEHSIFGSGAMVLDNDFHAPIGEWCWKEAYAETALPIKIGRGVFVGARAIILKGVTIGDRAVIGAGAVVTKDVPAGHLAAGNPAQIRPLKRSH